ncbi:MAG: hypothetical protein HYR95_00240 [Candidatus Colwellbacteria bacterium]|nr:hypothetical protein [Candidatus Colwellbacteria bacterium]
MDLINYIISQLNSLNGNVLNIVRVFGNIIVKLLEFLVSLIRAGLSQL